jgi:molybdenum cofactor synthesis domain-containing protein
MSSSRPTAAILLIGNELLSGRVQDENLGHLTRELWELGVRVTRAALVADEIEAIVEELNRLRHAHTWVFTSGGIGPTHDDVTIAAVAQAFGRAVVIDPGLEQRLRLHYRDELTDAHLRMAQIPEGAQLVSGEERSWPTVNIENVFIFPGVPTILRRKFAQLRERFRQPPFHRQLLTFAVDESRLVPILDRVCAEYGDVMVGSYPVGSEVVISFEADDPRRVEAAAEAVALAAQGFPRG